MPTTSDIYKYRYLQRLSFIFIYCMGVFALVVLAGWQFNIEFARRPFASLSAMNPMTGLVLCCMVCSFLLAGKDGTDTKRRGVGITLAVIVTLAGALKLTDFFTRFSIPLDSLLYSGQVAIDSNSGKPNAIAPITAVAMFLSGLMLLRMHIEKMLRVFPLHILAVLLAIIGLLGMLGFIYHAQEFFKKITYLPMPVHTAFCFFLFSLAVIFREPGSPLLREFTSIHTGSQSAGVLLVASLILPAILGLLHLAGEWAGFFTAEFGDILLVVHTSIAFIALVWFNARTLNRRDIKSREKDRQLAYLGHLVEQTSDAIFSTDVSIVIKSWNKAAEEMYGYTAEEAIGKTVADLLKIRHGKEDDAVSMATLQQQGYYKGEYKASTKTGSTIYLHASISTLRNDYGMITGYVAVHRDITEKKEAEKLREQFSEELTLQVEEKTRLVKNIVGRIRDGFYSLDNDRRFTYINEYAASLMGRTPERLIRKHIWTEFPEATASPAFSLIENAFTQQQHGQLEFYYPPYDKWFTVLVYPSHTGLSVFFRDVTEVKKAEESIVKEKELSDTAINSLPGIFYMLDIDRKFMRWNKNFEIVSGYHSGEIEHITPALLFAEEDRELVRQKVVEIFEKGSAELEARFLTKSGEKIPYFLTGQSIFYQGRHCMLGTGIDIALLKKTQEDYSIVVNTVDGIVWEADAVTFQFSFVSLQAERLLGYPAARWINEPNFWADHIHPDDKNWAVEYCITSTNEMRPHEFEYRMIAADGRVVWLRDIVSVTVENGKPARLRGIMIDITEKRKTEEEIVKTNARFQIMSKATSDIVWDWDLKEDSLWWNDNYYSNLGYAKEREIVDIESWYDHIHPHDLERVKTNILASLSGTASAWRDEYRYRKSDGSYLDILDRGYIMRNSRNEAYRMIGSMVDMTPIYNVQKKVAESENRLRTILDTDPECIKLLDIDCNLLDINKAGQAMIEANSLEQLLGQSALLVVDDAQKEQAAGLVRNVFNGMSGRLEFRMIGLKGTHRWCEVSVVPFRNADGEIISALGVTRDITEKKNAEIELARNEEKYRTLVEQAVDAIALYDETGRILDVNTGSVNLLGYSKEELAGMFLKEILTEDEMRSNPVRFDVLQQGKSTVKQRKMRRKDGIMIETEVRSQQLPDGRFLSVIRDLTERLKAERELAASYEAIRKLTGHIQDVREEERTSIAREIHDELGQQLTVLKMDISWLKRKIGTPGDAVQQKIKDLLSMLDETVKTVRRISSELRPSLLDDLGLLAAMEWHLKEFEQRSGLKTVLIATGPDIELPDNVKTGLYRIFQESLTNVARHAGAKKVEVILENHNREVKMRISDNGKGFDIKVTENKRTLGILGMKERTAMMGGTYEIESKPDKGTTVIVIVTVQGELIPPVNSN